MSPQTCRPRGPITRVFRCCTVHRQPDHHSRLPRKRNRLLLLGLTFANPLGVAPKFKKALQSPRTVPMGRMGTSRSFLNGTSSPAKDEMDRARRVGNDMLESNLMDVITSFYIYSNYLRDNNTPFYSNQPSRHHRSPPQGTASLADKTKQ